MCRIMIGICCGSQTCPSLEMQVVKRSHTCITRCGKVAESSDDALQLPEAKGNATYLDASWIDEFQGLQSSQCTVA